jgi:hypothetical protein
MNRAVSHKSGTTPAEAQDDSRPADIGASTDPAELVQPGFGARGRIRRRARFLRRARELAYRDLGGLVFNLHRFGQRNDQLVIGKLTTLGHIDAELRTLESALAAHRPVTVLREAGITACARCAAIHSSEDHFCPNCGLALSRHADLPIAGAATAPAASTVNASQASTAPAPATAPAPSPAPEPPGEGSSGSAGEPAAGEASEAVAPAPSVSRASPAPARAPAPDAPARPRPSRSPAGRSPTPRSSPAPSSPPAQATSGEDEPTEILHPPSPGT